MHDRSLYFGDNLKVLREKLPGTGLFDLIYLDPPFNSNATYNILFREGLVDSEAQVAAFEDTWHWTRETQAQFTELVTSKAYPERIATLMQGLEHLIGHNDMLAYLTMMAVRLVELERVLKDTGTLYLHCDPTASHYLKIVMDAIFGKEHFRNEIIWRRTGAHGKARRFAPIHDVILFYTKTDRYKWKSPKRPYMRGHVKEYFVWDDKAKAYRTNYYGNVLTGSGIRGGESGKAWRGVDPTAKGRHWAIPGPLVEEVGEDFSGMTQHQKLDRLYELGYIKIEEGQSWPIYERFITERDGVATPDISAFQPYTNGTVFGTERGIDEDVRWLSPRDQERLGYPTQKPVGLLRRLIEASTDPGDLVLDPFGGCGTTVDAAEQTGRRWAMIDVTMLAINLVKLRLARAFPNTDLAIYIDGVPADLGGARALFEKDPFNFEYWCLDLVNARPSGKKKKGKMRGPDRGADGVITIIDAGRKGAEEYRKVLVSVKGGGVASGDIRDLSGTVQREKAAGGVFITLRRPSKDMQKEATEAGTFTYHINGQQYPALQILTVEAVLHGARPQLPPVVSYAREAVVAEGDVQVPLDFGK